MVCFTLKSPDPVGSTGKQREDDLNCCLIVYRLLRMILRIDIKLSNSLGMYVVK